MLGRARPARAAAGLLRTGARCLSSKAADAPPPAGTPYSKLTIGVPKLTQVGGDDDYSGMSPMGTSSLSKKVSSNLRRKVNFSGLSDEPPKTYKRGSTMSKKSDANTNENSLIYRY